MAPLVAALERNPNIEARLCVTAQHRHMLDQVLDVFAIKPDYDLDIMGANQDLTAITCLVLTRLQPVFREFMPDCVLVHGDTTTTMSASLAAYYEQIPVCHVEAGLRTGDIYSPFPEEVNRKVTGALAALHFAPTEAARLNLIGEGVAEEKILVTGNTVVDALLQARSMLESDNSLLHAMELQFPFVSGDKRLVLITGHRRESFGGGFHRICQALALLADDHQDVEFVYPVHLNPQVQAPVTQMLSEKPNIHLLEPLEYLPFVYLMIRASIILTDSGGIQEEGPSVGSPVLVMRETTERPEVIEAGAAKLVGTDTAAIVAAVECLLTDDRAYAEMVSVPNPCGDGQASGRIVDALVSAYLESV